MPAAIISSWVMVEDSIMIPTPNLEAFYSMRQLCSITKKSQKTYLGVVNLSSNKEGESRSEPLFEVHTNLTRAVNLSPESSHPKVVLGTQSCQSFPLGRAQH